jgi:hypothetical protein
MILWGKIQDFSIFSILQFLAAYKKTGILEIQDFEEYGYIYLTTGRVDAISIPLSDDLLGKRLVMAGALTEERLKECLMAYSDDESHGQPLGAILLSRGYTDRETLQRVVNEQTYDQALQISNWATGTFKFVVPEVAVRFPITPSIDVEHLLIESWRRLDEGERPRREKVQVDSEICLTCTIVCNEEIKSRFLKSDMCLWRNLPPVSKEHAFLILRRRRGEEPEVDPYEDLPFL